MVGALVPKLLPRWGLLRPAHAGCGGPRSGGGGRSLVVLRVQTQASSTKNNQLRTGADKGNPTV